MTRTRITRRTLLNSVGAASFAAGAATPAMSAGSVAAAGDIPGSALAYLGHVDVEAPSPDSPGDQRALRVLGGSFSGRRLAGTIVSGSLQCSHDQQGRLQGLQVHLIVRTADGSLTEYRDAARCSGETASMSGQPELQGPWMASAMPSSLVSRLDAADLDSGSLRLLGVEVG